MPAANVAARRVIRQPLWRSRSTRDAARDWRYNKEMASCPRCDSTKDARAPAWCKDCELLYDRWVRRHATDIVWQALVGTVIVSAVGLGLPVLGVGTLVAAGGAFAGFGAIFALSRATRRLRRRQFLSSALPRAYLPVQRVSR
jgi:hypothetical protein